MIKGQNRKKKSALLGLLVTLQFLVAILFGVATPLLASEKTLVVESDKVINIRDASPGDIIYIPDGSYNNLVIILESSGNAAKPIYLKAKKPGKVTLNGTSSIKIHSDYTEVSGFKFEKVTEVNSVEFVGAKYSRLTDCVFTDCSAPRYADPRIITVKGGAQNNRVDHCLMQGNTSIGMGVTIVENDRNNLNNAFDHNYFKDFVKVRDNVQEAIQIGQLNFNFGYYANTIVEFNLFEHASGEGEYGEIISNKSSGNIYRYNTFHDCLGSLSLRTGGDCTVAYNWFFNVGQGLKVFGDSHKIYNNYFEGGDYGLWLPAGTGRGQGEDVGPYETPDNCIVAGNSFFNCRKHAIYLGQGLGSKATYSGRTYTRSYVPLNCKIYNNVLLGETIFLLKLTSGVTADVFDFKSNILSPAEGSNAGYVGDGVAVEDVRFAKTDSVFRVVPAGQVLLADKGTALNLLTMDIDGQRRNYNPDIGCDEFVASKVLYKPLTEVDVGPKWLMPKTELMPPKLKIKY